MHIYVWCVLSWFSCIRLFTTPWTLTHQAPLSMEFSRQEYWGELPLPVDLSNTGIEPLSPESAGGFFFFFLTTEQPGKSILPDTEVILRINLVNFPSCWEWVGQYSHLCFSTWEGLDELMENMVYVLNALRIRSFSLLWKMLMIG